MTIEIIEQEKQIVAKVSGRLDIQEVESFCDKLLPYAKVSEKIILDFSELDYISSAGLRGIAQVGKEISKNGGIFNFYHLKGMVKEVITLTGFSNIFKEIDTL